MNRHSAAPATAMLAAVLLLAAVAPARAGTTFSFGISNWWYDDNAAYGLHLGHTTGPGYYRPWHPGYAWRSAWYDPWYDPYWDDWYGPRRVTREVRPGATWRADVAVDAWSLLGALRYEDAAAAFAHQSNTYPEAGAPRAGFALANAALGDYRTGIDAMRDALNVDPDALRSVRIDPQFRPRVEQLAQDYELLQGRYSDAPVMTAALAYLLGDAERAARALTLVPLADAGGDPAARNLRALLIRAP